MSRFLKVNELAVCGSAQHIWRIRERPKLLTYLCATMQVAFSSRGVVLPLTGRSGSNKFVTPSCLVNPGDDGSTRWETRCEQ